MNMVIIPGASLHAVRASDDFWRAVQAREEARRALRYRNPGWRFSHRLDMARAIRFWRHYAEAVRAMR